MQQRVGLRLRPVARRHAGEPQHRHRRKHGPSMPRRAHHLAQRHAQPGRNQEDRNHLQQIAQRRRVLERMRRVRIEEPAAVGPQHLDRLLRGHRPLRDRLRRHHRRHRFAICACRGYRLRLHQRRRVVGLEVLHHALRHQRQRIHQADRQQHPQRSARQVHPEVAQRLRLAPRDAADERDRQRHAHRRRPEVVRRQPHHLGQVAHRGLGHIRLPVGVGGKRRRSVPRQIRLNPRKVLRVPQRNHVLQPLDRIGQQHRGQAEDQHRHAILGPVHLRVRIDARQAIEQPLHRAPAPGPAASSCVHTPGPCIGPWASPQAAPGRRTPQSATIHWVSCQNFSGRRSANTR